MTRWGGAAAHKRQLAVAAVEIGVLFTPVGEFLAPLEIYKAVLEVGVAP